MSQTKNIIKELESVVDRFVKSYKDDLQYDIKVLLEKRNKDKTFYFLARECGTNLIPENDIHVKDSLGSSMIEYYEKDNTEIYKITIEKKCTKYVYGDIEKVNKKEFYKEFYKINKREYKGVKYSIYLENKKEPIDILIEASDNVFIHNDIIKDILKSDYKKINYCYGTYM